MYNSRRRFWYKFWHTLNGHRSPSVVALNIAATPTTLGRQRTVTYLGEKKHTVSLLVLKLVIIIVVHALQSFGQARRIDAQVLERTVIDSVGELLLLREVGDCRSDIGESPARTSAHAATDTECATAIALALSRAGLVRVDAVLLVVNCAIFCPTCHLSAHVLT